MKSLFNYCALLMVIFLAQPSFAAPGKFVTVKEQKVMDFIAGYLLQFTENRGVEVRIKHIGYRGDLKLPAGKVAFEVIAPRQWEGWGRASVALIVRVDDRVERNLAVAVEVEALADMVVAVRPLERGEIIGPADVVLQKRDLAVSSGKICRDPASVIGKRVKIGMRGNSPVRSDYVERLPLVKSGQMVTILVENKTMRITALGKAKNAGAEGDLIMVQNLSSMRDIPARVLDSSSVKVDF